MSVFGLDLDVERTDVVGFALEDGLVMMEELSVVDGVVVLVESCMEASDSCDGGQIVEEKVLQYRRSNESIV